MEDSRAQEQGLAGMEAHLIEQQRDDDSCVLRVELGQADRLFPLGTGRRGPVIGAGRHHGRGQSLGGLGVESQQPRESAA